MSQTQRRCGGTFADLLLINEEAGATFRVKVRTTPVNQAAVVLDGIERVCASAGIKPSALTELMHGTTATTNAVLEGKGARVGLVTTQGCRQILQVARSYVTGGLAGWIIWPKPEPLAALDDTVEVRKRIGARGEVVRELDEASAQAARGRGRYRVADKCLREPRARTAHPRDRQRGSA
jgi:N-methylhydantoinase A